MNDIIVKMRGELRRITQESVADYTSKPREKWVVAVDSSRTPNLRIQRSQKAAHRTLCDVRSSRGELGIIVGPSHAAYFDLLVHQTRHLLHSVGGCLTGPAKSSWSSIRSSGAMKLRKLSEMWRPARKMPWRSIMLSRWGLPQATKT